MNYNEFRKTDPKLEIFASTPYVLQIAVGMAHVAVVLGVGVIDMWLSAESFARKNLGDLACQIFLFAANVHLDIK